MDQSLSHFVRVRNDASFEMWKILGAAVDVHSNRRQNIHPTFYAFGAVWGKKDHQRTNIMVTWCVLSPFVERELGVITLYNQEPLYNKKKKSGTTTAEMTKLPQGLYHKSRMFHSKLVKMK